jgi:hypothetical protein
MDTKKLLDQWRQGLRISHRAHFEAAKYYQGLHLWFGLPSLVISTLFGTTVFTTLQGSPVTWVKYFMAILSLIMILMSSLQTFFRYAERSERHSTAGVQIGEIRRELEQQLAFSDQKPIDQDLITKLRKRWDAVDSQAPTIPSRIYNRTAKLVMDEEGAAEDKQP